MKLFLIFYSFLKMSTYAVPQYIQFGIPSGDEIIRNSVCEISKPYTRNTDPMNTPYDPRMGPLENKVPCPTCSQDNIKCPGHHGHIILSVPIFNPKCLDICVSILKCICIECGSSRILKEHAQLKQIERIHMSKRLKKLVGICDKKIIQCPVCHNMLPKIYKDREEIKYYYKEKENSLKFTAENVFFIFQKITNDTFQLLGFNENISSKNVFMSDDIIIDEDRLFHIHAVRPESFIFTVLPVIPPLARPYAIRDSEKRDDDLTDKYNSIVKVNEKLRSCRTDDQKKKREQFIKELTLHIYTLIDNKREQTKLSSGGRPHKSISDRLKGKEGRGNANVVAKRVDFSARSVIDSAGPELAADEIGMSSEIAKELSQPEIVIPSNIKRLSKLLKDGKVNSVTIGEDRTYQIRDMNRQTFELKYGYIVHRQLQDGDYGLFGRQPTLRQESMQGVRIKIHDDLVFKIPMCVTQPYNADQPK